jgi:elongation factor 1-alpha
MVLVIDARTGPIDINEDILLVHSLWLKQLIIVIDKMNDETINWSSTHFLNITKEITNFACNNGFTPTQLTFIPISTLGDNVERKTPRAPWYTGPTIFDAFNSILKPEYPINKSLRIPILDVYRVAGIGTVIVGRVESGLINVGMRVSIVPIGCVALVKSIEIDYYQVEQGRPGDTIAFNVRLSVPLSRHRVVRGMVVGDINDPPQEVVSIIAEITVLGQSARILQDSWPVFYFHTTKAALQVKEIVCKVHRRTGEKKEKPKSIKSGEIAVVILDKGRKSLSVETVGDYAPLGRFVVYDTLPLLPFLFSYPLPAIKFIYLIDQTKMRRK